MNGYVQACVTGKAWTALGPTFGEDDRKDNSYYEFSVCHTICRSCLQWPPCKLHADPDLWMRPEICPEDKVQYYTLMLCYVDDILCIHQIANSVLCTSLFNSNRLHDVVWSCTMISTKHVQQIVSNLRPM